MPLKGKQVVITGGTGGIGMPLCQQLIAEGAKLIVIARGGTLPFEAELLQGDLSTQEGILTVAKQLQGRDIDILIQVAGVQYFGLFENQPVSDVISNYTINLLAPVLLAQAVLPQMKQRKSGHIVNVGSTFGSIPFAHFVTYSSAKAGLRGFSEALRREVIADGIHVTHISPRAVATAMNGPQVQKLAQQTKMSIDNPETVATRIMRAIKLQHKDVYIGFPENIFVRINAFFPRMVDKALFKNDRLASRIANEKHS